MLAATVFAIGSLACEEKATQIRLEGRQITSLEIRSEATDAIEEAHIRRLIASRPGTRYRQDRIDGDLKALYESGLASDVRIFGEPDGQATRVVAELALRPGFASPGFVGNTAYSDRKLAKVTGLTPRGELTSDLLDEAARRIEVFYRANGHERVSVSHRGEAIFVIDEGE
ncbi:outer membrane protein assembly factor BamA [Haloferula luteola]|uniref:Outer membrane protein assembly factor BamA n=1 Tax=Haloferula luteola TaxID=595692 RepID=A0A840VEQ5_9BACT|nr:POTRA domain-containing protein [Haloferula luteola]MBB5353984.1 outer membrane protein assembly factor BamA [Haloferula luteola]